MIELRDILIRARQESQQMRHYFIGVEHLCIAMLLVRDSLLARLLSQRGLSLPYAIEALRRRVGKGGRHRLWAGIPNTPRVNVILTLAQEIASEEGRQQISERDLLLAILDEGDSLALHVLKLLTIDLDQLRQDVLSADALPPTAVSSVHIELSSGFTAVLSQEVLFLLRQMFADDDRLRVNEELASDRSGTTLLLVTPIRDSNERAPLVVKIAPAELILDEVQRYERYVKAALPPMAARIEERPSPLLLTDFMVIKYVLAHNGYNALHSLRTVVQQGSLEGFAAWLRSALYHAYAPRWWGQRRPFKFEAWQEYDTLLPPILTLDYLPLNKPPQEAITIRHPLRRQRLAHIHYGQVIHVENCIVHHIDRTGCAITLASGHGNAHAIRMIVQGVDLENEAFFRGEMVDSITGRVVSTRYDLLMVGLADLSPDFDPHDLWLMLDRWRVPNPFMHYQAVLDRPVIGMMSLLHGALHLGNIILGTDQTALLVDFSQSREGHTLFDWAVLEVSLLAELGAKYLDNAWNTARTVALELVGVTPPRMVDPLYLESLAEVRQIVTELLAVPDHHDEYWVALAVVAMRASLLATMSVPQRRLMVYVAGFAIGELLSRTDGHSPDAPEVTGGLAG